MKLLKWQEYSLVFVCVLVYAVLNAYLVGDGTYHLTLLPVLAGVFYLLIIYPVFLFYAVVFVTPFSFLYQVQDKVAVYLPTEPLILCLMGLYLMKQFIEPSIDKRVLRHPLTIVILVNIVWMFLTSFTSTMPFVSFKFFLVRLWYVTVFYFLALDIFRDYGNIKRFLWVFIIGMGMAIIYATLNHATLGISRDTAMHGPQPIFKDQTIYGATVALIIPVVFSFFFRKRPFLHRNSHRIAALFLCPLFFAGLVFFV